MEKNLDPKIIVLDAEVFAKLLDRAECGEREWGGSWCKDAVKHAARFNPAYGAKVREEKLNCFKNIRDGRRKCKAFVRLVQNKVVYKISEARTPTGIEIHFIPGTIHGIAKHSQPFVIFKPKGKGKVDWVRPSNLRVELPEGYVFIESGEFKGNYGPIFKKEEQ